MSIDRVLVAFDRSSAAEDALAVAAPIAAALDAAVEIVYVWEPPVDLSPIELPSGTSGPDEVAAAAEAHLAELRARGVATVGHHVEFGDAAQRLLAMAASGRYRLLVLGTRGRRGLGRMLLGSVAADVVRAAACPVLTLRRAAGAASHPAPAIDRIVVADDFAEASEAALARAVELAERMELPLELVHVVEPTAAVETASTTALWAFGRDAARGRLDELRATLERRGVRRVTVRVESGVPAERLLAVAEEHPASLLVMGTHGRRGISRWLLGSVAEKLVQRAPCPVLTVHATVHPAKEAPFALRRDLHMSFEEALARLPEALRAEGFGTVTELDLGRVLHEKRRYRVLGACSAELARRALEARPESGVLLPFSVAVYDGSDGNAVVAAVDPLQSAAAHAGPAVRELAEEAHARLTRALERLP